MNNQSYSSNKPPNPRSINSNPPLPKSGPKSQRSVNLSVNGSIKSNNAVEGSVKGSLISYNSALSKKTQKSILSMYPQMISKQSQSLISQSNQSVLNQSIRQQKLVPSTNKHPQQNKSVKKQNKTSWYIDQDFYYSSEFKRNFVKGMISLTINKNIEDITLLLREIAPTIMLRSCDTIVWVSAYLIIFKIEYKIRRYKLKQQQILEVIQDNLVQFLLKNKDIKKIRLIKIIIYLLKQLPVNKPKIMTWFEDFIRKNKDRLIGIDITKYIDIHTMNPVPIDYNKLNRTAIAKAKYLEKQKQKEKKKQIQKQKNKQKQVIQEINLEQKVQNILAVENNSINNQQKNINQYQEKLSQINNQSNYSLNKFNVQKKQNVVQTQKLEQPHYLISQKNHQPLSSQSIKQLPHLSIDEDIQLPKQQNKQEKNSWLYTKIAERLQSHSHNISRPKMKNNNNFIPKHQYKNALNIQKIQNNTYTTNANKEQKKNIYDNQKYYKQLEYENQHSNTQQQSNPSSYVKHSSKPKIRQPTKTDEFKLSSLISKKQQKMKDQQNQYYE